MFQELPHARSISRLLKIISQALEIKKDTEADMELQTCNPGLSQDIACLEDNNCSIIKMEIAGDHRHTTSCKEQHKARMIHNCSVKTQIGLFRLSR